ncbi:MAG: hypothetical protein AAFQ94_06480 [Bacteroidota bacterium]
MNKFIHTLICLILLAGSFQLAAQNQPPVITSFSEEVQSIFTDQEVEISFAEILAVSNATDTDGTIDAFKVMKVSSGSLLIGSSRATASEYEDGINDLINGTLNAYWTPERGESENDLEAFEIVAVDDDNAESTIEVGVPIDVVEMKLNELLIHVEDVSDASNEFVEFSGTPGATVPDGTYFLAINGSFSFVVGSLFNYFDLSGFRFGQNGYIVLVQRDNTFSIDPDASVYRSGNTGWQSLGVSAFNFRNNSYSFLLIESTTLPILNGFYDGTATTSPDGILEGDAINWRTIDGIGLSDGDINDVLYAPINFSANGNGLVVSPNIVVDIGGFRPGYFARTNSSNGSTANDWVTARIKGTDGSSFTMETGATFPSSLQGRALIHVGSDNTFDNQAPIFTSFSQEVASTPLNTEVEISLTSLISASDANDIDGTVDAFLVKSVSNGTLTIGADAGSATAFAIGSNDRIDANNQAYWTPASGVSGLTDAFELTAIDNEGAESTSNITAQIQVGLLPTLTSVADDAFATYTDQEVEITFADLIASSDAADADGTVDGFIVQSVASGTLRIGSDSQNAVAWSTGTNDEVNSTNNAYWLPDPSASGTNLVAFNVVAADNDMNQSMPDVSVVIDIMDEIRISEVYFFSFRAADIGNEFIELFGTVGATIPKGTYFASINGERNLEISGTFGIGEITHLFDLGGLVIGSNGYLVLLQSGNSYNVSAQSNVVESTNSGWETLSNATEEFYESSQSYLLFTSDTRPTLSTDYDNNNDGTLDGDAASWNLLDGVGRTDGSSSDVGYGLINFSSSRFGIASNTIINTDTGNIGYFARNGNSTGSNESDWYMGSVTGNNALTFELETNFAYPDLAEDLGFDHLGSDNPEIFYWQGNNSTFTDATNWNTGTVPGAGSRVVIEAGGNEPIITGDQEVFRLELRNGALMQINSGASLTITDKVYGNGDVNVLRNTTGSSGYSLVGSPVTNADISDMVADYVYDYDGLNFSVPTGSMAPGKGFFVGFDALSPEVSFVGTPNSGTITIPVFDTGDAFNIVANPYTAAISRSDFITANSATIDGNIWLWDDGGSNVGSSRGGDYILVNNMGTVSAVDLGDGVSGQKGSSAFNGNIGSMQGFLVNVTTAGPVTFNTNMIDQTAGGNSDGNFFRQQEEGKIQSIKLSLSGNDLYNELLVGFHKHATEGKDFALDGPKFSANDQISFYSILDDEPYAIQALPFLKEEPISIPLGIEVEASGEYWIQVKEVIDLPEDMSVLLIDKLNGKTDPLTKYDQIPVQLSEGVHDGRFFIQFTPQSFQVIEEEIAGNIEIIGSTSGFKLIHPSEGMKRVAVYTISGHVLFDNDVEFKHKEATVEQDLLLNTLYILKVDNETYKFKIK